MLWTKKGWVKAARYNRALPAHSTWAYAGQHSSQVPGAMKADLHPKVILRIFLDEVTTNHSEPPSPMQEALLLHKVAMTDWTYCLWDT